MNVKRGLALLASGLALGLAGCGGGDMQDSAAPVGAPHAVVKAGKPTGAAAVAVHLYQALYGKAPSYALMTDYTAQATADAATFASSLASAFASTSHAALAKLVLDNLGVTATTVKAVNAKNESEYTLLLDAVQQIFAAYPTMRGQVILNMTNLLDGLEADVTYGGAAVAYNNQATGNHIYATNAANTSPAVVSATGTAVVAANGVCVVDTNASFAGYTYKSKQCYSNRPTGYTCDQAGMGAVAAKLHKEYGYPSGSIATYAFDLQATCPAPTTTYDMGGVWVGTLAGGDPVGYLGTGLDGVGYRDSAVGVTALFNYPEGITSDGTNLYVADNKNRRIRQLVISTGAVTTLAGSGLEGSSDGIGLMASFIGPNGIATDGKSLFVLDYFTGNIRRVNLATKAVTTLATVRGAEILTSDGTNLYVVGSTILKVAIATGAVTNLAGAVSQSTQAPIMGTADGTGAAAQFRTVSGIATDGTTLYVLDSGRIRKIDIASQVVTTWVSAGAPAGRMSLDGTYLYVAGGSAIHKIALATGVTTKVAGGNSGFAEGFGVGTGNGVPGQIGNFYSVRDIVVVGSDLYVTDSSRSSRIRKIAP